MTAVLVAALILIPAPDRADECRYMTADGRPGYRDGEVAKTIRCVADRLGVSPTVAVDVAECESHLYPRARNGPYRGVYQIGPVWDAWWRSFTDLRRFLDLRPSVWNVRSNVAIAIARARGGWSPWSGCVA